jgi:probable rRNA maturation factor
MDEPPSTVVVFRRVPAGVRRAGLHRFARTLGDEVAGGREFECLITNDAELRRLNREFRGKDYATDVLSFSSGRLSLGVDCPDGAPRQASGKKRSSAPSLLGSMAISYQRAAEQAARFGHSAEQEIRMLMLHGLLHLLGLDHETDRGRMARIEAAWRRRLALPAGLIERVCR